MALIAALALAALLPAVAAAQTQGPPPPTIGLDAPRFDATRNVYLLDMVYTRADAIGTLEISIINPVGVEVLRVSVPRNGRNQSVEVDASKLQAGQNYKVEVKAFDPSGSPIIGQNGPLLAQREFTHLPGQAHLSDPRFKIDSPRAQLVIEIDVSSSQPVSGYRVLFVDKKTQAVILDRQLPAPPPLAIPLKDLTAGEYQVTVIALDANNQPLTEVQHEFTYETGATTLGNPLFEYQSNPPALLVRLQPVNSLPVAKYAVSLIEKNSNQVALDYTAPAVEPKDAPGVPAPGASNGATVAVPVKDLPAGSYIVLVRALDPSGQELARVDGETTYTPPAPPSVPQRILSSLAANPLIPILIVVVLVAAIGAILVFNRWERQSTATPMLHGWNVADLSASPRQPRSLLGRDQSNKQRSSPQNPNPLPLNRTLVADPNATPILENLDGALPELLLKVVSTPDKKLAGKQYKIIKYPFTMGRIDCDLSIGGDEHISRRHAELHFDGQGLVIVDRLSSNGTFVEGERIAADQPIPLNPFKLVHIRLGRETQIVLSPADRKAARKKG